VKARNSFLWLMALSTLCRFFFCRVSSSPMVLLYAFFLLWCVSSYIVTYNIHNGGGAVACNVMVCHSLSICFYFAPVFIVVKASPS